MVRWYYTPMMLPFSRGLAAARTVYDCMDELVQLQVRAPGTGRSLERELLKLADVVFTGGYSLWEAKKGPSTATSIPSRRPSTRRISPPRAYARCPRPADQAAIYLIPVSGSMA